MKYKMLVMDIDGTLLPKDKTISQKNREAIKAASDMGIKVVVSTGRLYASAYLLTRAFGNTVKSIISSNGAQITREDIGRVVYEKPMKENDIFKILNLCAKYNAECLFHSGDTIFAPKKPFYFDMLNQGATDDRKVKFQPADDSNWERIIRLNEGKILKGVIMDNDIEKISLIKKDIMGSMDVEVAQMSDDCIEITHKGVSKGNAVKHLTDIYGICMDEVICIGDNENDISMIRHAGLGIAMGNGNDIIKRVADFVTLTDENDGVAYAVEKFILSA